MHRAAECNLPAGCGNSSTRAVRWSPASLWGGGVIESVDQHIDTSVCGSCPTPHTASPAVACIQAQTQARRRAPSWKLLAQQWTLGRSFTGASQATELAGSAPEGRALSSPISPTKCNELVQRLRGFIGLVYRVYKGL